MFCWLLYYVYKDFAALNIGRFIYNDVPIKKK